MILRVPYSCHIMSKIINLFHFVAELKVYFFPHLPSNRALSEFKMWELIKYLVH